ncbi:hypothetical protein DZB84_05035 [Bacillus sp. HNG]|nr:hypothetical protein DZB84_05035 [Bacillus sp. HNG]
MQSISLSSDVSLYLRKAQGALVAEHRLTTATSCGERRCQHFLCKSSIRRALTEGVFYLQKRLAYDLEPMTPGARHLLNKLFLERRVNKWMKL